MRDFVAETRLDPANLIQVLFVRDGIDKPEEIPSMPGQYQHTVSSLLDAVREARDAGVRCVDLFGIPLEEEKDAQGSEAWNPDSTLR